MDSRNFVLKVLFCFCTVLLFVSSGLWADERGLVGYWTFNEVQGDEVADISGEGNNGKCFNNPQSVAGVDGTALSFEGKDDYVEVPHAAAYDFGGEKDKYTIAFWFRSSQPAVDPPDAHFLTKNDMPYPFRFVQTSAGSIQFRTYDGATCTIVDSGLNFSDGNWHYVVGMRNGEERQLYLYIDNFLVTSGEELGTGNLRNEGPLRIGRSDGDDFNGTIDDVRIFNRILSKEEMQPLHKKPADRMVGRKTTDRKIAPIRAEGTPVMRKRLEIWEPTVDTNGTVTCARHEKDVALKNDWMEIRISQETGEIMSLTSKGKELLCAPGGVSIRDVVAGIEFAQTEGKIVKVDIADDSPGEATVSFQKQYDNDYTATITYNLGTQAVCCDVRLETDLSEPRESRIEFNLPMLSNMTKAFWTRENAPFDMSELPAELLVYRNSGMNTLMVLPSLTVYNPDEGMGLSLVAPFDLPKPGLYFKINTGEKRVQVSNIHLRLAKEEAARAAVYIVPHEGCWRPALAWMVKTYPDYFYPGNRKGIETPGWYFLGGPHGSEADMQVLKDRGCKWYQIHSHFPFYGLYMPKTEAWDVVVGLADQGKANLSDWEAGKEQGGYPNSYDQMREAIALRQKYDMQPLLYFQSFELWEQYGEKYCVEDIARGKNGKPHGAWYHCNLMNPDPAFAWGKDITAQIKRVPEEYPEIDGIFYDRDDYKEYDYAHDDGITMDVDVPCYPLCFAQQQINDVITGVLRDHDMTIITNGPTSVEVCKYIDGIMAESNIWGASLQYLGLVRPMTLLPYFFETNTYDQNPAQAEYKLKMALCGGFYPSLTYGEEDSQRIDQQYRPLFDLMKDREWVLNANALTLDAGMSGNIFRSSEGHYLATVVDFKSSKVEGDLPVCDVKVAIRVPDASDINYCYVLSGDYAGPVAVPITREQETLQVIIPVHLASSMAVFTKEPLFEVARSSMPLFTKGKENTLSLDIHNLSDAEVVRTLKVSSSCFEKTEEITLAKGEVKHVSFQIDIPGNSADKETDFSFTVELDGKAQEITAFLR